MLSLFLLGFSRPSASQQGGTTPFARNPPEPEKLMLKTGANRRPNVISHESSWPNIDLFLERVFKRIFHPESASIMESHFPNAARHCVLNLILYGVGMFENVKANLAAAAEKLAHLRRFL
jgi:hypothetical protein